MHFKHGKKASKMVIERILKLQKTETQKTQIQNSQPHDELVYPSEKEWEALLEIIMLFP